MHFYIQNAIICVRNYPTKYEVIEVQSCEKINRLYNNYSSNFIGCYNLIWYFGAYKPYNDLQDNFPEIEESGMKIYVDKDDFQYSVAVPDYLLWNGNLAVTEQDIQYALIVWIKPFKSGFNQGILFNGYNNLNTQIMLKNNSTAEIEEDQAVVDENNTVISMLFNKANEVWMLGLE